MGTLAAAASTLTVVTYLVALLLSLTLLVSTSIGQELVKRQANIVLGAFLIETTVPLQINAMTVYVGLFVIYLVCFIVALRENDGLAASLRKLVRGADARQISNWFAAMPLVSSALLLLVIVVVEALTSVGLPPGSLQAPPYKLLFGLAYSPVVEEVTFRISTLGLLVAARALWHSYLLSGNQSQIASTTGLTQKARLAALALVFPERAKNQVGLQTFRSEGWQGIHMNEWILLAVTSIGFGLAHPLSDGGYEPGKAVSAALQGFVIGISYLVFGAHAAILFHWYFDVYFYVFSFTPSVVQGAVSLLIYATGLIGFAFLLGGKLSSMRTRYENTSTNGLYPGTTNSTSTEA